MRSTALAIVMAGSIVASSAPRLAASGDACAALTQTQLSAALGVPVGAGSPISGPANCQWTTKGKIATLTVRQPLAGRSPVEQFSRGKQGLPGITVEPAAGVGDDAYYVYFANSTRAGVGLVVKKGSSVFEIRVYGFEIDQAKPVAKTLAQNAAGKI